MDKLQAFFLFWSGFVAVGTVIGFLRLRRLPNDAGPKISVTINIAYAATTALAAWGIFEPEIPDWWIWSGAIIGCLIVILAQALSIWSGKTLGASFSPSLAPVDGGSLVQVGPYQICRHPIMLSYLMLWLGTAIALGSWLLFVSFGLISIVIMRRVALEERKLATVFSEDYQRYRKTVSLIVPFLDPDSRESKEIEDAVSKLADTKNILSFIGKCR